MSGGWRVQAQVPAGDGAAPPGWLACLREVCELLWPPQAVVTLEGGKLLPFGLTGPRQPPGPAVQPGVVPQCQDFALVSGIHRPPLMVPAVRQTAAAAVRHHSRPRSAAARMGVRMLCLSLGAGLGGTALCGRVRVITPAGADTIETYLRTALSRDITVSLHLGPARANRKPVLQLQTAGGEPIGFAKIGINPLTHTLVRAEHDTLTMLNRAGLAQITIPRVLHYGTWRGLEVLVLSALPAWLPPRRLPPQRLAAAMTELAAVDGLWQEPLAISRYLRDLRARLAATVRGPEQAALAHALGLLATRDGQQALMFGSWHGDWSPWNMAITGQGLLVWDWERFASGVPLGFDALHHRLQTEVTAARGDPRAAAARCPDLAPGQLAPFGLGPRQARLTGILYLAELATRYLTDKQAEAGAPLGAPGTWLVPAIARAAAQS
jgi:hypothetical protein